MLQDAIYVLIHDISNIMITCIMNYRYNALNVVLIVNEMRTLNAIIQRVSYNTITQTNRKLLDYLFR